MIQHNKKLQDFNYKYLYTNINSSSKLQANLTLWKVNNRLSPLKSFDFLEKFINPLIIKHTKLKYKKNMNNSRIVFYFNILDNLDIFEQFITKLPLPETRFNGTQYTLIFNFYKFKIRIPISISNPEISKITQIIHKKWQDI